MGLTGEREGGNRENLHLHLQRLTVALIQSDLHYCFVVSNIKYVPMTVQKCRGLRIQSK